MKIMNEKIILGTVGFFVVLAVYSLGSGYVGAQIVEIGTNNTSIYLFENLNVTVLVNNTAQYDLFTQVECNFFDPENNLVSVRSQCDLVNKRSKKNFLARVLLNKQGDWRLQSCVAYSSLQIECRDSIPQHTYKYEPYLVVSAAPRPNSIQIANPSDGQVLSGIVEISAVAAGNYQKLEFGYASGPCNGVTNKRELDFSYIPIIYNWNTTAVVDGNYNICLFLSGFGFNSTASRNITVDNYNFTLNPSSVINQSVSTGQTINYTFTLKNRGVSDTFSFVKTLNPSSGSWNSKMFLDGIERSSITLGTNEESIVVVSIDVPFVNIGTNALLSVSAKNSKNENIDVQQELLVGNRVKRGPIISNIIHPDHIEQGQEALFIASIRDPDGDDISSTSICYNENCSSKLCDLSYEASTELYKCNSNNISSLSLGTYNIFFTAMDSTGVRSVARSSFNIDSPASINILQPYLNERVFGNLTIKADIYMRGTVVALLGIGTDASCSRVSFRTMTKDQLTNGSFVYTLDTETMNDGKYFLCVKAVSGTQETQVSRVVYVDNYNFELNPIYQNAEVSPSASIDLNYTLVNTGKRALFDLTGEINSSDFQLVGFIVGTRLVDRQTSFQLDRGESVNITAKLVAATFIGRSGMFSLKAVSNGDQLRSKALLNISASTNTPPVADRLIGMQVVNSGNTLNILLRDIQDKENDLLSKKDVCADEQCSSVLCSLQYNAGNDNKYSCQYTVNSDSGSYFYYVVLRDDKGHETRYMKQYFVKNVQQPTCGGTFSGGYLECSDYTSCVDKEFPPPCYKKQALGTDGCLRGKVCCKSEQKGCSSSQGCGARIVSKSCIYDQGTNKLNVYSGIDWYGGGTSDIVVGTKRSSLYRDYSYIDQQTIDQDGIVRILANVYGVDGSLYCSNETYVYCYRSAQISSLTGAFFSYPVSGTSISGVVGLEATLNGSAVASFAYSSTDRQCTGQSFSSMSCIGDKCRLNFDTTILNDGAYYFCLKAEGDRVVSNYTSVNVKNYDFILFSNQSTNYVSPNNVIEYPIIIKNIGGVNDTYSLSASISSWTVYLSKSSTVLGPGQSEEIKAIIRVPDVADGQRAVLSLRVSGTRKNATAASDFIVRRESGYAPSIRNVTVTSPVEQGSDVVFSAGISSVDSFFSKACRDASCTDVYCAMDINSNSIYQCSYNTNNLVPGTYRFYIRAENGDRKTTTSEYYFNVKERSPPVITSNLTGAFFTYPVSGTIMSGIVDIEGALVGQGLLSLSYSSTDRQCAGQIFSSMYCLRNICKLSIDTTRLNEGTYYFCLKADGNRTIFNYTDAVVRNYDFSVNANQSASYLAPNNLFEYPVVIKNTGGITDTYTISSFIDKWNATVSRASITLASGQSEEIKAIIRVPDVNDGQRAVLNLRISSTRKTINTTNEFVVRRDSGYAPVIRNVAVTSPVEQGTDVLFSAYISSTDNFTAKACKDSDCTNVYCVMRYNSSEMYSCRYDTTDLIPGSNIFYVRAETLQKRVTTPEYLFSIKERPPLPVYNLTGAFFTYPTLGMSVSGIIETEVGLKGSSPISLAYSSSDRQCTGEIFTPMNCNGNVCRLNFDTTKLNDGSYYFCLKPDGNRTVINFTTVNIKNYDFVVNSKQSTNYVASNDLFEYNVTIKNIGGIPDTYNIVPSIDRWNVSLSKTTLNLNPGQSEEIKAIIRVPDVADGQKAVLSLRVSGLRKTIITTNDFIVKRVSEYAPVIRDVSVTSPVYQGSAVLFSASISSANNISPKVCRDENCVNVYCVMSINLSQIYSCNYDTTDLSTGTNVFYVRAENVDKKTTTSEYYFNVKDNLPFPIPVSFFIRNPPSASIIKGIFPLEINVNGTDDISYAYSTTSSKCSGASWTQINCFRGICSASLDTTQLLDTDYYLCARYGYLISSNYPVIIRNYNHRIDPLFSNNSLRSGASNQLVYSIKNIGFITDNYTISASIDRNWGLTINPQFISLSEDNSVSFTINVDVPPGLINQSARLVVTSTSQKNRKVSTSISSLTVSERSNTAPIVTNISTVPSTVDRNSSIKFLTSISDIENDAIVEKKICLDEFCQDTLCSDMNLESGKYVCTYIADRSPRTYEYFVIARDSSGQMSQSVGSFTIKAKQISQVQQNNSNIVSIPKLSPRNSERLSINSVSISSIEGTNFGENAIDGSTSSFWSTKQLPATITADLGSLKDIDGIGVYSTFGKPINYDIELSQDCTSFFSMQSIANAAYTDDWNLVSFKKTAAKCVKLTIQKTDNNALSITELHVYASRAVSSEEEKPLPTRGFDFSFFIIIGIVGVGGFVLFLFRENIIDWIRETMFRLKYND